MIGFLARVRKGPQAATRRAQRRAVLVGGAAVVLAYGCGLRLQAQSSSGPARSWNCWVMSGSRSALFPIAVIDPACLEHTARAWSVGSSSSPGQTVTLAWTPGAGDAPTSYFIEAGSSSGRSDLASFTTGSNTPSFTATSVPPGTYFVRVRAQNGVGMSAPSNEIVLSILSGCAGPPSSPSGLTATASGTSVTLAWHAPSGSCPATNYVIEAGSGPGLSTLANFSTGSASTTFSASGVPPGAYFVRVRSGNAAGSSAPSNEATLIVRAF